MSDLFEGIGGDGSHRGLADWYDEHEAALAKALKGKRDFNTGWYGSKHEIASARITRRKGKVVVEVSVSDDFDTNGRGEREVNATVTLDTIREAIDNAWDDAKEDRKANQGYRGYSLHDKRAVGLIPIWFQLTMQTFPLATITAIGAGKVTRVRLKRVVARFAEPNASQRKRLSLLRNLLTFTREAN